MEASYQEEPSDAVLMWTLGHSPDSSKTAKALETLCHRFETEMLAAASSELRGRVVHGLQALDIVQEVFTMLLLDAKAKRYDASRPLRPWLLTLVHNKARDLLRSETRRYASRLEAGTQPPATINQALADTHERIEDLLSVLGDEDRGLIEDFYLGQRNAREIAQERGIAAGQVYRELHRIRTRLRTLRKPDPPGA